MAVCCLAGWHLARSRRPGRPGTLPAGRRPLPPTPPTPSSAPILEKLVRPFLLLWVILARRRSPRPAESQRGRGEGAVLGSVSAPWVRFQAGRLQTGADEPLGCGQEAWLGGESRADDPERQVPETTADPWEETGPWKVNFAAASRHPPFAAAPLLWTRVFLPAPHHPIKKELDLDKYRCAAVVTSEEQRRSSAAPPAPPRPPPLTYPV